MDILLFLFASEPPQVILFFWQKYLLIAFNSVCWMVFNIIDIWHASITHYAPILSWVREQNSTLMKNSPSNNGDYTIQLTEGQVCGRTGGMKEIASTCAAFFPSNLRLFLYHHSRVAHRVTTLTQV